MNKNLSSPAIASPSSASAAASTASCSRWIAEGESLAPVLPKRLGKSAVWRSQYPFASQWLELSSGAKMHCLDEGPRSDSAVLCVHGNPSWSFLFRDLVLALRETRRVLAPDHIGMGLSDKPADYRYTLRQRIDDLAALVDASGVKQLDLVVHDWGGAIGFGLAARMPERIRKIVVLNTAAFPDENIPKRISVCRWPFLGALLVRGFNGFAGPAARMTTVRPLAPTIAEGFLAPYGDWRSRVAVHQFVRDIPMEREHPSRAELQAVADALPQFSGREILLAWGMRDFCFTPHFLRRFQKLFPNARSLEYASAGHYVLEDATESLAELKVFLRNLNTKQYHCIDTVPAK